MGYKVAICDDSEIDRSYISDLVSKWAVQTGNLLHIDLFDSAESFLFHYADQKDYDLLLLDIEMGSMDGVSMAKKLRQENDTIQIIFITGYSDYISEGYEVEALHYLMKPIPIEKLYAVLQRAVEKISKNEKILNFEVNGEMVRVPIYQIRYAEVFGNYVSIYAADTIKMKMTLAELEQMLDERFYRVSRSVIINLQCIRRVTKKEVWMQDGSFISLPRGAYERLNRAIIDMG